LIFNEKVAQQSIYLEGDLTGVHKLLAGELSEVEVIRVTLEVAGQPEAEYQSKVEATLQRKKVEIRQKVQQGKVQREAH